MHPQEFAVKWRQQAPKLSERAAYQEHWRDLCTLLGQPTPSGADPEDYAFEKHVKKVGTGETGFADVFKRDHFIVEYKAQGKSLGKALQQALLYARELGNPPLLIVSDLSRIEVHTNFTGSSPRTLAITLDDLAHDARVSGDLSALAVLRSAFLNPSLLDPRQMRERVTQDATAQVGQVARSLAGRGVPGVEAAHFLMRLVFAMFAEDVGLLPKGLLTEVLERCVFKPENSKTYFQDLFSAMQTGGEFMLKDIKHFNGGLFDDGHALTLSSGDAGKLLRAAKLDWSQVEPAIFGTLFEQSLDAGTRSRRGAHFTPVADILDVVEPVIMAELRAEWTQVKQAAERLSSKRGGKTAALQQLQAFHDRLAGVRVLDPACGSGNFLVVTLGRLLDLEHEVRTLAFELGAGPFDLPPKVHPRQLLGLEVEAFAHELASVSVWIAYIQWNAAHGGDWGNPVLQRLDTIHHQDAVLSVGGQEPVWPEAEFIVGNPPFVGNTRMRATLGDTYTETLRATYAGRVPGFADFVTYWFEKARAQIAAGHTRRAGLIATNSIRGGANAQVLERLKTTGEIFLAWPDRVWVQDGAAVRVSLVGFDDGTQRERSLHWHTGNEDDPLTRGERVQVVGEINADLSGGLDLRQARRLTENAGKSFEGVKPAGKFDVPGEVARAWLTLPNPAGVSNADVLRPFLGGEDITDGSKDRWIVDFGQWPLEVAEQYRRPMGHVTEHVKPVREKNNRKSYRERWWLASETRPGMRAALRPLSRYLATPRHMKHRAFVWCDAAALPGDALTVVATDQEYDYGLLNSGPHVLWGTKMGSSLEDRPRYTPTTTFETFPFPEPTPAQRAAVEQAARYLEQARAYLGGQVNPASKAGKNLGLTDMYNLLAGYRTSGQEHVTGVATLADAHALLDQAVAAAYGWEWPMEEEEVLAKLLALNLERAGA